jgi:hypothetical protein
MRTYQHSGIVPIFGAIQALAIGCAAAVGLGIVYAFTFYYIPYVYLNFALAVGFGYSLGWVVGWAAREGNIRNTSATVAIAVVAALVGLYVEWGTCAYAMCPIGELASMWNDVGLLTYLPHNVLALMSELYENGSWGLTENQSVTGLVLVALWVIEAGTIVFIALAVGLSQVADRPFCEACQRWITGEAPHLYVGDGNEPVWTEVQNGNFDTLADTPRATGNEPNYVRVNLHSCDSCELSNYLSITRCQTTTDNQGNPRTVESQLVTNLVIDSTQIEILRAANTIAPTVESLELAEIGKRQWTMRSAAELEADAVGAK